MQLPNVHEIAHRVHKASGDLGAASRQPMPSDERITLAKRRLKGNQSAYQLMKVLGDEPCLVKEDAEFLHLIIRTYSL